MIYAFTSRDTPSRSVKDEPDACGKEVHVGSGMQKSFEVLNSVTVKAMAMGDAQSAGGANRMASLPTLQWQTSAPSPQSQRANE
ncbi:hypothetical protein QQF64_027706 [Cirrhinus molitorella]|uniref:Uncharacterized protein n=1 Tax=Cirrhinus molitorella TaxID=172907 RepID=A0ABR3ND53_9TELE